MPPSSRWACSPGRTILTGFGAAIVAVLVGSGLYAAGLTLFMSAALVGAGVGHGGAGVVTLGGASVVVLAVECTGVALAAAVPTVLLGRNAASSPRWWPPLLAGLVVQGVFWGVAIASARGDNRWIDLYLWPTHLSGWLWLALAQVVAVNLGARKARG